MILFIICVLDCMNNLNIGCFNEHPRADPSSAEQIASNTIDWGWIQSCLYKNKGSAPSMEVIQDNYLKVYTPLGATSLILVDFS